MKPRKKTFRRMKEVTKEDLKQFLAHHTKVRIGENEIALVMKKSTAFGPGPDYVAEGSTVWSFRDRGGWATHSGDYRGNWSPFIPRNLIERYTKPGDLVLDQMMGSGTTLVECKLLGRYAIGVDINPQSAMLALSRLDFAIGGIEGALPKIGVYVGDARRLNLINDGTVDLIATHPPYAYIIGYSNCDIEGDLSTIRKLDEYIVNMRIVAKECYRVLKDGAHCAILIGDTRRRKHFVPIATRVMLEFLQEGFILREHIVKLQWNTKTGRERWSGSHHDFYKIAHENLFVFRKPGSNENLSDYRLSSKWW